MTYIISITFAIIIPIVFGYIIGRNQVDPDTNPEYYK